LAETLLKKETLNYDDVEKLIGPPPFGKKRLIGPEEFEQSVNKAAEEEKSQQQEQS
jgi:spastic paraplegia protein 7